MSGLARYLTRDLFLPDLLPGRMLEFGCSYGSFLHLMATKGWEVKGVEPSEAVAEVARREGLDVQAKSLEQAECEDASLDLIVGWMALEHLHEPVAALRKLWSWAKPTGMLVVSVPDASSLDFTVFREHGFAVQAPTHLFHFTPRTIKQVMEASGWQVERITHQRSEINLMKSVGYSLQETRVPSLVVKWFGSYETSGLVTRLAMLPLAQLLGWTGHSGRMVVWATRMASNGSASS